ncbi:hypothetical protein [Pseudochryseolinea flava]|nr:hypothetical protein [Pseudochryseolinea flava]
MQKFEDEDPMNERLSGKIILRNMVIAFVVVTYFYLFLITMFDI